MKHIFYSCIFATAASMAMPQANAKDSKPMDDTYTILLEEALSDESPVCNDPACNCSMLVDTSQRRILDLYANDQENEQIECSKIHDYAKQFVRRNFPIHAKGEHQTSVKTHNAAQTKATNICAMIVMQLTKNNTKTISSQQLNTTLKTALSSFFINEKYPSPRLIAIVDKHIKNFLTHHEYTVDYIPAEMKKEYASERTKIILHFKKLMDKRKTDIIPELDIQKIITSTFQPFIQRMRYIHLWNWAMAETANLRKDDPTKTASSYLIPNPASKKLEKYIGFMYKK